MIAFLLALTLRQLLFRKTTLMLAGLASLPVLVALVFRLSDSTEDPNHWTARALYLGLMMSVVLPLTALLYGTSVLGDELEDGTAVYLLTKPVARWQILAPKVIAAWIVTSILVVVSTLISGLISIQSGDTDIVFGACIAVVIGALAYCAVFAFVSLISNHALIAGLVYIFLWEGALSGLFEGLRYLSIRHYTIGISDWLGGNIPNTYDAYVSGQTALILAIAVTLIAALMAHRRLQQIEVREAA
ncbi:MAG TPA: ABC transporter permease [Dehalococcoidia bacterium]|nr:ABC transporter permease [Dehalococcoidia bacterium]